MPSRRSDRGNASRRLDAKNKAKRADLESAIEERRRWESERDHLYRTGWENWDMLDNETRQDLVRESAVIGGLSALGDVATSPRRLGVNKGAKEVLKRMAPDLARKALAGKPRKAVVSLMDRLRKVRNPQEWSRANQERWNMAKAAARREGGPNTRENTKFQKQTERARTNDSAGTQVGPPSNQAAWGGNIAGPKPKDVKDALRRYADYRQKYDPYTTTHPRDVLLKDVSLGLNNALQYGGMNIRDAYYRSGGQFDYIQNLSNRVVPVGVDDHEQGRIRDKDKAIESFKEAERIQQQNLRQAQRKQEVDEWKKNRGWTGVSRTGSYFDLEGRPTKEAKRTGATNMWDVPLDEWNKYFTNDRGKSK